MAQDNSLASYFSDAPLLKPWTEHFDAPTGANESNDPGYNFRLGEGMKGLQRMAAAKGTLLTGGTVKGAARYAQDYASNEFDKVYGRARQEYMDRYGIYNNNQQNQYNRLSGYAQMGLGAIEHQNQAGYNYDQTLGDIYGQKGNAQAGGAAGSGRAWSEAAGSVGDTIGGMYGAWSAGQPHPRVDANVIYN